MQEVATYVTALEELLSVLRGESRVLDKANELVDQISELISEYQTEYEEAVADYDDARTALIASLPKEGTELAASYDLQLEMEGMICLTDILEMLRSSEACMPTFVHSEPFPYTSTTRTPMRPTELLLKVLHRIHKTTEAPAKPQAVPPLPPPSEPETLEQKLDEILRLLRAKT